ncbi:MULTISPECIES: FMN-binding glutamate synthase family protein [Brevibacterium]|uniref:Glutamate synthase domain-containing protein 2 n=2 Tax=Brevibacterium TaxID=1696 RepID=A0A2H1IEL6_9MICO|nr:MULTISPECIES: FMN-binding glutamate synthase family protein [Brevibacterium]SMX73659.1 Glutamate synthase domain-containing protein 2 [Brevibacterium antiquum CNRZ 918]HCG56796.1 FMN-binding glutamate synthase family protein [Brevibacterium sp.]
MGRFLAIAATLSILVALGWAAAVGPWAWWVIGALVAAVIVLAIYDLTQKKHAILRNYPVVGHLRFLLESLRPELQQYFIERNWDGRPFDRDTRSIVYERSKGIHGEKAFGTERDVNAAGYEYLTHSTAPVTAPSTAPRVMVGGPDCSQPYSMSLLNVSAMSFGALSPNAVRALNRGAEMGGFAHDTGEGGISPYHLENNGDLIWEVGSGYFGTRTDDGRFDPDQFAQQSSREQIKCVSLKLSQGAKPGIGGVLPAAKVTAEIARARGVPEGEKCVSPAAHSAFSTPTELIEFIARMRELSGGKPAGFKLCVGSRIDVLAICKAIKEVGTAPDFIIVDGSEGGTGAAPLEFEDHMGTPLTDGLLTVHNALVGTGLRDQIRIGASGKVAAGNDIVKRLAQGADYTNSARAMMMAVGCIQAQICHTGLCPVGVTTQDPKRQRALHVGDKSERVQNYQKATVDQAVQIMASMGVSDPRDLRPEFLQRNIARNEHRSYAELYEWLEPGELLAQAPESWATDWARADSGTFRRA